MTRRKLMLLLAFTLALVPAVAACGGGDDGGGDGGGGGTALELTGGPGSELKFDKTSLEAAAGEVTITMTNEGDLPHDVAIEGNGVDEKSEIVQNGETATVTATLEPGEYTFYCSVPGHQEGGMEGTLRVT